MKLKITILAAAAFGLLAARAGAVDFNGYTRVGPGQKQASGDGQRCFSGGAGGGNGSQAPGKGGIGRLGNECETYGEFGLSQTMTKDGVSYKALLMTNFYSTGSTPATADANTPRVNQLYVEAKGYSMAPALTFWVGRRFYHRADVHFDDSFYVFGGSSGATGAGVDTIPVGSGSLGVAVFRKDDASTSTNAGTMLNVDLQSLVVNPGGKLRVLGSFSDFSGTGGKSGAGLTLQHNQTGVFGAENTLWVQTAQGSTALDMFFSDGTHDSKYKGWRIADSLAWLNGPLTAQTLLHYGQAQQPNGVGGTAKSKTLSLAGRVAYAFTRNFKLQGELGTANTKPNDGIASTSDKAQNVTKLTIAPTLAIGPNYYDRPELRFYASYFKFNDAYKAATGQSKNSKTAVGVQAEIWF